jgi:hypothetical protein
MSLSITPTDELSKFGPFVLTKCEPGRVVKRL